MKNLIIIAIVVFGCSLHNTTLGSVPYPQCKNPTFLPDLERKICLQEPGADIPKIGKMIDASELIWGESIGWVRLRTTHAELEIGSNILAGWIWLENCGWVCLGNGRPLDGRRYSNRGSRDWGINNNGRGDLSGYAWSEVTGWISFHTGHSRVYLDESGQFYGYAWGENAGWMHFGPGWCVQYSAKADPGPWRDIGPESEDRLAGGPDDSAIGSGSFPVAGLKNDSERYNKYARNIYFLRLGRDDFCAHIRCYDTPVYISSLAKLSPIRAPPLIV
ncbi:MAG: hypothetical protein NTZ78_02430 [Candidatus Aureabacteria bacterium]|nr:hypothetical protein [Candidatus Auribacterota bacterium]